MTTLAGTLKGCEGKGGPAWGESAREPCHLQLVPYISTGDSFVESQNSNHVFLRRGGSVVCGNGRPLGLNGLGIAGFFASELVAAPIHIYGSECRIINFIGSFFFSYLVTEDLWGWVQ